VYLIFIYMKKTHRQLMKEFFYPDNLSDYNLPKNSELNKLIDKSYIINLKKDKHKLNRFMKNKNHKTFKNDFNVIEAINGKKIKKEKVSLDEIKLTYKWFDYLKVSDIPYVRDLGFNNEVTISDTEIAICLSHLKCWRDFHQNGKQGNYALIVEDDVCFSDNFENKLKLILDSISNVNYHMLYVGYLPDAWSFEFEELNEFTYKIKNGVWFLSSYIISWEAINELLNRLPIFGPVDMWIQFQFDFLKPIATKKFLCIQEDYYKSSNTYSFYSRKHNPV
jgi:GR25 family glycosyltransferase involved in LPS biosynthesis